MSLAGKAAAAALLFPSLAAGCASPPAAAMAAGCPGLAADLPAHNEVIPERCLLPATDLRAWTDEVVRVHKAWKRAGGVPRIPDDSLIDYVRASLSPEAQGEALSRAYEKACR